MSSVLKDARGVGYGKPPEHTRFQKGQSGNPRGRPKKTQSQPNAAEVDRLYQERCGKVPHQDGYREISGFEAMCQGLKKKALQGDVAAAADLLALRRSRTIEVIKEKTAALPHEVKGFMVSPAMLPLDVWQAQAAPAQAALWRSAQEDL